MIVQSERRVLADIEALHAVLFGLTGADGTTLRSSGTIITVVLYSTLSRLSVLRSVLNLPAQELSSPTSVKYDSLKASQE